MPEFEEGEDAEIDVFPFPTIDGNGGAMGGGDTLIVFNDDPANVQAVKDWITPEWLCTLASETGGGIAEHGGHGVPGVQRLPGHKDVDPNCYETEAAIAFAETITEALGSNTFVFDASDLMPPRSGSGRSGTAWSASPRARQPPRSPKPSRPPGRLPEDRSVTVERIGGGGLRAAPFRC